MIVDWIAKRVNSIKEINLLKKMKIFESNPSH